MCTIIDDLGPFGAKLHKKRSTHKASRVSPRYWAVCTSTSTRPCSLMSLRNVIYGSLRSMCAFFNLPIVDGRIDVGCGWFIYASCQQTGIVSMFSLIHGFCIYNIIASHIDFN